MRNWNFENQLGEIDYGWINHRIIQKKKRKLK